MSEAPRPEAFDVQRLERVLRELKGLTQTLGISVDASEGGRIVCRLPVDERHQGAPGVAHGGAITSLMDTALGLTALGYALERGKMTSTVELKVNFLKPVPVGAVLQTSTTLQAAGRSLVVISGEAHVEGSATRVAFATGTFNLYRFDPAAARSETSDPDAGDASPDD